VPEEFKVRYRQQFVDRLWMRGLGAIVAVYLIGVVVVAMSCTRRISVATSLISVAAFDFFCVPPYLTFQVSDYQYLITFSGMLLTALVISTQTARIRNHAAEVVAREARNETLYKLSRRLAGQGRMMDVVRLAAEYGEEIFDGSLVIFLPQVETSTVATLRAQPGKSLLAGFVLLVTTPVAAGLLILSILGLPIGLALGALYAMALVGGLVVTAFFIGDAEVRWLAARPMVSPSQHALLLCAGVVTLAVLRSLLGGVIVLASVLFGVGALMLSAYQAYSRRSPSAAAS